MADKKFTIANRCSFILFMGYLLTYIALPIVAQDTSYLIFLIFPLIFLIALIINLSIKYNKLNPEKAKGFFKIIAVLNILFNGFGALASSLFVGTIDWEKKKEEIRKYPSIEPAWIFVIMFATILFNIIFGLFCYKDFNIDLNLILLFTIISLVFLALCQISSSFSLYYNNGKKELKKFWRNIIVVVLGLIFIVGFVAIPTLIDDYKNAKEKEEFQEHLDNINNNLNQFKDKESVK